jgi:4,5-DOPA dioxygenase extradiol
MGTAGRTPAIFVGHGSPMNAIEENEFTAGWLSLANAFAKPRAVLCVSAHWETRGIAVTAAERPGTIHDFRGFPPELGAVQYPAPGDPELARAVAELLAPRPVRLDAQRGLDHGAWSVLRKMYPEADVPLVQLGMDTSRPAREHRELARALRPLRDEGVLVLGSGNLVHDLAHIEFERDGGTDWAERFDRVAKERIRAGDLDALVEYSTLSPDALRSVPTPEHYLPLLYVLALRDAGESVSITNDRVTLGTISMTCVAIGLD